jgi:hypothetical protein
MLADIDDWLLNNFKPENSKTLTDSTYLQTFLEGVDGAPGRFANYATMVEFNIEGVRARLLMQLRSLLPWLRRTEGRRWCGRTLCLGASRAALTSSWPTSSTSSTTQCCRSCKTTRELTCWLASPRLQESGSESGSCRPTARSRTRCARHLPLPPMCHCRVLISTGRELPACGPVLVNTTAEGGMARYQDPVKRPVICSEEWFKEKGFEVSYFPLPGVIENYGKKA